MQYRKLGRLDWNVSEIGFGAWGIGGDAYGKTDDETSRLAILTAIGQGINFFDTSDLYGNGHSEELLGRTFQEEGCRSEVYIATKFGTLLHTGFKMPQDFSVEHLRKSLEGSLRRLRTDYIDLYQVHSPPVPFQFDEIKEELKSLKQAGKIRAYGISVRIPNHTDYFESIKAKSDAYQFNFNLVDNRALITGLIQHGDFGKIVRTPFCFGFLTGEVDIDKLEETDHRRKWPREQLQLWQAAGQKFEGLVPEGWTRSQFCLVYCLSHPISVVIPGMVNRFEVIENCKAANLRHLSVGEQAAIERINMFNNYFFEPSSKGEQ